MEVLEVVNILQRVRQGETEAYEEIVRLYQRDVSKVAASMLRDLAATENLVQQTFVNAFFHLHQFEAGADFGVWIKAIARNLVREELRKRTRSDEHLRHYHRYLEARLKEADDGTDTGAGLSDSLKKCRERLTPVAAKALAMRYENGFTFDELARELGRTVDATRQLLARIRVELRNCIERRAAQS